MGGKTEPQQPKNYEEEVTFGGQGFAENDPEGLIRSTKNLPATGDSGAEVAEVLCRMNTAGQGLPLGPQLYPSAHLTRVCWLLQLLISLGLFVLVLATLVQVSRIHGYPQGQTRDQQGSSILAAIPPEQTHSDLKQIQQQLTQINASLASLCRPCPWDWELFQGSCYLFSRTLGSWEASASSCRDLGAHLVIVNSVAEQQFLKYWHIRKKELTWIGLSDHSREGSWQWVDDTPLRLSFWKEGEPNNEGDEDCVELMEDKWNDKTCTANNFWVCEQPSVPCPSH